MRYLPFAAAGTNVKCGPEADLKENGTDNTYSQCRKRRINPIGHVTIEDLDDKNRGRQSQRVGKQ